MTAETGAVLARGATDAGATDQAAADGQALSRETAWAETLCCTSGLGSVGGATLAGAAAGTGSSSPRSATSFSGCHSLPPTSTTKVSRVMTPFSNASTSSSSVIIRTSSEPTFTYQ